tara:strand:- start:150 stop:302 length:153 start_codon:yes stop_codon:yes gene_type:complete
MNYELIQKIENIVNSNITHVEYEGYDVNKGTMVNELVELFEKNNEKPNNR